MLLKAKIVVVERERERGTEGGSYSSHRPSSLASWYLESWYSYTLNLFKLV